MSYAKIDEWLIAENIEGDRTYIVHWPYPQFIAEVHDFDGRTVPVTGAVSTDGTICVELVEFGDEKNFIEKHGEKAAKKIAKLMRQACDAVQEYDQNLGVD
jgi:hypothetical protein